MDKITAKKIKDIISKFSSLKGSSFVGIREYRSSSTNELANHVVIADFSYGNAVQKDLQALKSANESDIKDIAFSSDFSIDLIRTAINKLIDSFEKNMNPLTRSLGSIAQEDAYIQVTNSIKLHTATGKLHIYALAVSKEILEAGEYKKVNSRDLTLAQNAVKKHFDFSTAKYRNFIIDPCQLDEVRIKGETVSL